MNITKKQWLIGASVVGILALGGGGFMINEAQVQAQKQEAAAQKAAYDKLMNTAKKAVEKAEAFTDEKDVSSAHTEVKKLKKADQTDFNSRVETVSRNWTAVKTATDKVVMAEKSNTDVLVKAAQKSLDDLKDKMTASKKAALQKRLDVVKKAMKAKADQAAKAAKEAKAKEVADQKAAEAQAAQNAASNTPETPAGDASAAVDQGAAAPAYPTAPAGGGDYSGGNYSGGNNTGGGSTGGGSIASPPPPAGGGNGSGDKNGDGHMSQDELDESAKHPGDWGSFFPKQ